MSEPRPQKAFTKEQIHLTTETSRLITTFLGDFSNYHRIDPNSDLSKWMNKEMNSPHFDSLMERAKDTGVDDRYREVTLKEFKEMRQQWDDAIAVHDTLGYKIDRSKMN